RAPPPASRRPDVRAPGGGGSAGSRDRGRAPAPPGGRSPAPAAPAGGRNVREGARARAPDRGSRPGPRSARDRARPLDRAPCPALRHGRGRSRPSAPAAGRSRRALQRALVLGGGRGAGRLGRGRGSRQLPADATP
ncbi:MAG: hypothetical protein E6K80_03975, partial [Candidatus Eisenbacteria bacterium]